MWRGPKRGGASVLAGVAGGWLLRLYEYEDQSDSSAGLKKN
jgi:hypothetical protein